MHMKDLGSVLLIAGTAIGAGMLALPMAAAPGGFWFSTLLMVTTCLLMIHTSLLILEVNLTLPADKNTFSSMAESQFGLAGKVLCWVCFGLLLYAITAAYISGMGNLTSELLGRNGISIPSNLCGLLFTLILGSAVLVGTVVVDRVNQVFLYLKGAFLFTALFAMLPSVKASTLFSYSASPTFWASAIPIFTAAFASAMVIPSITNYIGKEHPHRIRRCIIIGSLIPLFVYIFWIFVTFGLLPQTGAASFTTIEQNGNDLGMMISFLQNAVQTPWIIAMIDAFSNTAMTTSFLGVSLSLFDFLADSFSIKKTPTGRLKTFALTFIPPLIFVVFYPNGFLMALRYSAIFVSILLLVLPPALVWKKRRENLHGGYLTLSNSTTQAAVFVIGLFYTVCAFL